VFVVLAAGYFLAASLGNLVVTPLCRLLGSRYAVIFSVSGICMGYISEVQFIPKAGAPPAL
jgi:hypothetical protein